MERSNMCGPPDLAALYEAATRIVVTCSVLAGSAAVYSMKEQLVSSINELRRALRSRS